MLLPKDNNFHGMHTPKNAILTDWEMEAAMIVWKRANRAKTRDKYHGSIGPLKQSLRMSDKYHSEKKNYKNI